MQNAQQAADDLLVATGKFAPVFHEAVPEGIRAAIPRLDQTLIQKALFGPRLLRGGQPRRLRRRATKTSSISPSPKNAPRKRSNGSPPSSEALR
ncbi:MAG: hypothetical protein MZU97_12760 [Bacillus subtilis]|nr:hypothetical protein [Bacillus subtilis]